MSREGRERGGERGGGERRGRRGERGERGEEGAGLLLTSITAVCNFLQKSFFLDDMFSCQVLPHHLHHPMLHM